MMNLPNVRPVINWRNLVSKKGVYPIHLCVYIAGQSRQYYPIPLPQKVRLDQWTGQDNAWVANTHPFAFEINVKIAELKGKINELTKRFYNQGKPVSFYAIDRELLRKGDRSLFNDYFRNYIDHPPETVVLDEVTWEKYEACLLHLNKFNKRILFADIDETVVARFKNHLFNQKGRNGTLDASTVKSYFDKFKVVLTHAAKKENLVDLKMVELMFEEVSVAAPKKKEGQHLEIEELQALKKLVFTKDEYNLERDRDLFLFQVYTGLYYNDLQILKQTDLFNDIEYGTYLIGERDKNGNPTIIPLYKFPYSVEILQRFRERAPDNPLLFRKDLFIEVQTYNRNLKILAKKAGILRKVSNKVARHTNAQMWIRFGAERPVVSKMMGHQKEATTENYFTVNLREIIEGTKGVDFARFAF